MSSFSPATISLSPNFSNNSGSGGRSIPLRRTRVTVQLNVRCKFRYPKLLLMTFLFVTNRDCNSCVLPKGRSFSTRSPTRSASCSKDLSLPTALIISPSCRMVCATGMLVRSLCFTREITAPVIERSCNWASVFPNILAWVMRKVAVCNGGYFPFRCASSALASATRSLRSNFGSNFMKSITPITPNG